MVRFWKQWRCGNDVDAAVVAERNRSDKPSARKLCRGEIFARDASEERCGAHEILSLPNEAESVEAF